MNKLSVAVTLFCLQAFSLLEVSLADNICQKDGSYKTFYPGDCDKYYQCDNGKATEGSCGWFHRFDETSGDCKFHMLFIGSVDCTKSLNPNGPTSKPTSHPSTGNAQVILAATKKADTTSSTVKVKTQGTTKTSVTTQATTQGKTQAPTKKPDTTATTHGGTGTAGPTSSTKPTKNPNSVTTKKNAASSIEISMMLSAICSLALVLKQFY